MTLHTPLCSLLGIQHPIIQAPIGSVSCPRLAAAVSNAGGLGMLAMSWRTVDEIRQVLRETKALTEKPFGVNFVLDKPIVSKRPLKERLQLCLHEGVSMVSLTWGKLTQQLIDEMHQADTLVAYTVWNSEQAQEAIRLGVDILVAQGQEAGGHVNSQEGTISLTKNILGKIETVPVVAAGGIGNGADIATMLKTGASGVWMGTRFVASAESRAHAIYKDKIVQANASDTVLNRLYSIGWPSAPHRTLKNSTYKQWMNNQHHGTDIIAYFEDGSPIQRYEDTPPLDGMTGNMEALAHYAGTSVDGITEVLPAQTIIETLVKNAQQALSRSNH